MKKRRGDRLSSSKRQKSGKISKKTENSHLAAFEEEFGSISDYGQDAWNELSQEVVKNLSKTVVPVASFIGDQMYFGCTGIIARSNESGASILTSASLVKFVDGVMERRLMIQVRLPNKQVTIGRVAHYDLNYNVTVIIIPPCNGVRAALFDLHMEFGSYSKVVAVGSWFYSGKFMATTGVLTDEPSGVYPIHLRISTCKIPVAMTGGPLVDSYGNFVGMNFYSKKCTPLLPSNKIFDFLVSKGEIQHEGPYLILESTYESPCKSEMEHEGPKPILKSTSEIPLRSLMLNSEGASSSESESEECVDEELWYPSDFLEPLPVDEFTELVRNHVQPRGYPMPTRLEGGMHLVNTFEEEFAEDTWCKLGKKVASNTARIVVSLASFKDEKRFFACTGIIIDFIESTTRVLTSASLVRISADENRIDDNLKIKVYLPNKQLVTGTLQYCNLSYNVAVVSIVGYRCLRTVELHNQVQIEPQVKVVAVGRVFESGKLMATSGIVAGKENKLDCKDHMVTTCKITKAGIGGPLIDFDGNFVGMNFYGMKETHFLPRTIILELLEPSGVKWAVAGEATDSKPNRWHVPAPSWSYPSSSNRIPRRIRLAKLQ